jgi:hypothetical protein
MIDSDGDENYVPHTIPAEGGFPEALAPEAFAGGRSHLVQVDDAARIAYFAVESREESSIGAIRVDLASGAAESLWRSPYGAFVAAWTPDHSRVVLTDGYTMGDVVLYEVVDGERRMLYGTPIEERAPEDDHPLSGFRGGHGTPSGSGVLLTTTLFDDAGALGYLDFSKPGDVEPVRVDGLRHDGAGELEGIDHLEGDRYSLTTTSTAARGCTRSARRGAPHVHDRARARRRGRVHGGCPPRDRLRRGERSFRRGLLHVDEPDPAARDPAGVRLRGADA